jgi:hypothetical protein
MLFIGGSTTRDMFDRFVEVLGLNATVEVHHCNITLGHGCFDCRFGCRTKGSMQHDWKDRRVQDASATHEFTWKPEMLTFDDVQMMRLRVKANRVPDVVVVHKSIHSAWHWQHVYDALDVPEDQHYAEFTERAALYADLMNELFPSSIKLWRDAFVNHKSSKFEAVLERFRNGTTAMFRERGFHILPGYNVTVQAPEALRAHDGIHYPAAVHDVILSMMQNLLC